MLRLASSIALFVLGLAGCFESGPLELAPGGGQPDATPPTDATTSAPGETWIRSLAEEVGLTQKRLVRVFEKKVGLKPKTLSRVLRFQTVLKKIERESRVAWSFVAQEAGYYDQAHFIRDFESLSGLKPSQYLVDRGEFLNFVPVR